MGLRLGTGSRGSVGLDIDSGYLAAVEVRDGRIARAVSADLPAGAFADGEVNDPAALGAQLKGFVRSNDLPRRVRLGVANQQIAVRSMDLPAIEDQGEFAAAVRFQASDTIAMPLEEAVLDYQVVGESTGPEGSPRVRVVVAAARESMVNLLVEAARGAGLRPLGIDLSAFALVRALSPRNGAFLPGPEAPTQEVAGPSEPGTASPGPAPEPDQATVYCHLAGVTNLAVAVGSTCLFTRALSTARDEAGTPDPVTLAEEIRLSIDYYMAQPGAPAVGELVLAGPAAADDGLVEQLGGLVALPVRVPAPLENLNTSGLPAGEDPRRHTIAAGLALGADAA
jgi:type IV pilus assembly protein PilM